MRTSLSVFLAAHQWNVLWEGTVVYKSQNSSKFCRLKRLLGKPESGSLLNWGLNGLGALVRIEMRFNRLSMSLIRVCITKRHSIHCNYWLLVIDIRLLLPQCYPVKETVMKKLFCNKVAFLCLGWRWDTNLIWTDTFTEFLD